MSRLAQLGKDSLVYGVGALVAKGIGFLLLPLFTRIFAPAEYGAIEMLTTIASLLTALMVMGMDSAQSFYFFQQRERGHEAQASLVSAILQWRTIAGVVVVVLATLCAPLLNAMFFEGRLGWLHFAVAFTAALFAQLMSQSIEIFRLLYRPWPYVMVTLAQALGSAAVALVLILALDLGLLGYFLGGLVASVVAACIGWYVARDYLRMSRLHTEWWPTLLRFGAPLVPAGLAMYLMSTADRWFVQHYHGDVALGIYAVGAKFALILALAIETFRKAWWPVAMDAMHSEDGPQTFRDIARLYIGFGVAAVVYLCLLSSWLVRWFTGPDFHAAWPLVGVLAWQSLFYGFYLIASAGLWKAEKTQVSMLLMLAAALLNVLLNWWWVPTLGGMGAALATAVSYLAWIIASLRASERLWPVGFELGRMAGQVLVGAAAVACVVFLGPGSWWSIVGAHLAVIVLLASALRRRAQSGPWLQGHTPHG
ncbi:MAG: lipopolysaccharide biosynthesis protein [Burkholderiaceae bacterium]|nr:lipopolysaccharide biosynthesis protein [Burkholderiaceae bacterium]